MLDTSKPVPYRSLELLSDIYAFTRTHNRFPLPGEVCPGKSMRGSAVRHFNRLEEAGFIARQGTRWDTGSFTRLGVERVSMVNDPNTPIVQTPRVVRAPTKRTGKQPAKKRLIPRQEHQPSRVFAKVRCTFKTNEQSVTLTRREQEALYYIGQVVVTTGSLPSTNQVAERVWKKKLTPHMRAHAVSLFVRLELLGLIARRVAQRGMSWSKVGYLTQLGLEIVPQLPIPNSEPHPLSSTRIGGGLSQDGGTLFKDMLFLAGTLGTKGIVQFGDRYSKIGHRVKKAADGGHQMGLKIATFSLEEGRTCSPECGLRSVCYAGKMSRQRRIYYEGVKTDRAVAKAIAESGPMHWRINTVGDFPSETFVGAVLAAITTTCSTAWGYTHWAPEHPLGQMIRIYSDQYWNFFSIRTSYEHGSRDPLPERGAVIVQEFDPKVLALHNAVPCPEQTGNAKNCGECGLCWTTRRNVAFKLH